MQSATPSAPSLRAGSSHFVGLPLTEGVRVLILVMGWLVCVSGVLGNILLITTLLRQPALRSLYTIFIVNLSLADLVVLSYITPTWLVDLSLGYHPVLNDYHCKANAFITVICFNTSIFTLVFIGFNRYLNVCHYSLYNRWFNKASTIALCVSTWVITGLEALLPLFHVDGSRYIYSTKAHVCTSDATSKPLNAFVVVGLLNNFVSTILIGFFSVSTLRYWKKNRQKIHQWNRPDGNSVKTRSNLSSANMAMVRSVLLVFVLLLLLCLPLNVVTILLGRVKVTPDILSVCMFFFVVNTAINWIVYGALNKNIRKGYCQLIVSFGRSALRCMKCHLADNSSQQSEQSQIVWTTTGN